MARDVVKGGKKRVKDERESIIVKSIGEQVRGTEGD